MAHWIVDAITLAYQAQGVLARSVESSLYKKCGVLLGAGSWRLADRYLRAAGWATPNTFARFYSLRVKPVSSCVLTSKGRSTEGLRFRVGLLKTTPESPTVDPVELLHPLGSWT